MLLNPLQFGVQGQEWIILIIVVVVLLFGAKKIPELARSVGRARGEFEKGKVETEEEIRKGHESAKKQPEREKLENAATSLGIPVEGKSDEELREDVRKALEKSAK
ncbi:MAG: twin-arginine translocase TatA/TatE family subunit [Thaumarchaeota archaeon]|nr:twin-arginine translocase TatA/TatE family subunit [Nitrososphaerota archaeon]